MRKIYLASSWRNPFQPELVSYLKDIGHKVYDFRNPKENNYGFGWNQIDPNWEKWSAKEYIKQLNHPLSIMGFNNDKNAMDWADTCILLLPCGNSAHIEAGYMIGQGKPCLILIENTDFKPDLMYKLAKVYDNRYDMIRRLSQL